MTQENVTSAGGRDKRDPVNAITWRIQMEKYSVFIFID
jgi:hypothetical protein